MKRNREDGAFGWMPSLFEMRQAAGLRPRERQPSDEGGPEDAPAGGKKAEAEGQDASGGLLGRRLSMALPPAQSALSAASTPPAADASGPRPKHADPLPRAPVMPRGRAFSAAEAKEKAPAGPGLARLRAAAASMSLAHAQKSAPDMEQDGAGDRKSFELEGDVSPAISSAGEASHTVAAAIAAHEGGDGAEVFQPLFQSLGGIDPKRLGTALAKAMAPAARPTIPLRQATESLPAMGMRQLDIRLHPAELGVVTARLRFSGRQLSVEIIADTAEGFRRLSAEGEAITAALQAVGYAVDRLTVQPPRTETGGQGGAAPAPRDFSGQGLAGSGGRGSGGGQAPGLEKGFSGGTAMQAGSASSPLRPGGGDVYI